MQSMLLPLKRYAEFHGRSGRREYWLFQLAQLVFYVLLIATSIAGGLLEIPWIGRVVGVVFFCVILSCLVPNLALTIRRLHDIDLSGWFLLLGGIPLVGGIVMLVFAALPGTRGDNRFGPVDQ